MEDVHLNVTMTCCGARAMVEYEAIVKAKVSHVATTRNVGLTMTKCLTCDNGVHNFLKEMLHARADGNQLRRRGEVREVFTKLDALDNRLAEIEAVQQRLLEHVLAMHLQRQLSDAKT